MRNRWHRLQNLDIDQSVEGAAEGAIGGEMGGEMGGGMGAGGGGGAPEAEQPCDGFEEYLDGGMLGPPSATAGARALAAAALAAPVAAALVASAEGPQPRREVAARRRMAQKMAYCTSPCPPRRHAPYPPPLPQSNPPEAARVAWRLRKARPRLPTEVPRGRLCRGHLRQRRRLERDTYYESKELAPVDDCE